MPNYIPSDLVTGQAKLLAAFQTSELRFRQPVTFLEYLKNTSIMFPDHKELRTREDRPVTAYYKLRSARSLGTGRAHNHTGVKGDSGSLTPSWTTFNDKFLISLKQGDNNVFSNQEQFDNELQNVVANFAEGFETQATDHLFNNRSGVNIDTSGEGSFNGVQDAYEITETTNGDRAIQITKTVMHNNKYTGTYTIFCDTVAFNKFEKDANQGTGNSTNLSFQYGGVTFVHSAELAALAGALAAPYVKGFWAAVPTGTIAALPWIPKQNREGVNTKVNQYGTLLNPVDGETYALHSYETRADGSGTNGYTQDVNTEWEASLDIAFENAPLSTANETTIQAFALV